MKISSEPTRLQSIMFSLNMFLFMLAVTLLTVTGWCPSSSSSSSSSEDCGERNDNYDVSGPGLMRLYNAPVYLAERMIKQLGGSSVTIGPITHTGVRVTLADGSRWFIYKGCNFGVSSNTVVVDARHMSSDWRPFQLPQTLQRLFPASKNYNGRKTVSDFVRVGGSEYHVLLDNCHYASYRMMNQ